MGQGLAIGIVGNGKQHSNSVNRSYHSVISEVFSLKWSQGQYKSLLGCMINIYDEKTAFLERVSTITRQSLFRFAYIPISKIYW